MKSQADIFISHASRDKALAEKLVDKLLGNGCDISANRILCTSLEGMGIPAGTQSFIEFLRSQIQAPKLVILLLTDNYFASAFCVCELGAAWGMGLRTFPLIVPPLDQTKLKGSLIVTQAKSILESSYLDELRDVVKQVLNAEAPTPRWTLKRDEFLKAADKIIPTLPKPYMVDRALLEAAENKYQEAINEISEQEKKMESLNEQIADLRSCKDAAAVKLVSRKYTDQNDQFADFCRVAKEQLGELGRATRTTLYWHMRASSFHPEHDEWDDVKSAEAKSEILDHQDGTCTPNLDHPKIRKAYQAIQEVADFLKEQESEGDPRLLSDLADEHEFPISIDNKEFWAAFLTRV